ncbi:MAG: hypothetical protein GY820_31785 [Gammaproteobacteria bacterium]|nr:hypothetical protein [Gammaproteobacteria bacterium]
MLLEYRKLPIPARRDSGTKNYYPARRDSGTKNQNPARRDSGTKIQPCTNAGTMLKVGTDAGV